MAVGTGGTQEWFFGLDPHGTTYGLANSFALQDTVTGTMPFYIAQGAPIFSHYIDASGNTNIKQSLNVSGNISIVGLSSPIIGSITTATTGGTLAASTSYCYRVSAVNSLGITIPSTESCITTGSTTATNTVTIPWTGYPANMQTSYSIYGRTTGAELLIASGLTEAYTDTGSITPSGAMPTANTTIGGYDIGPTVVIPPGASGNTGSPTGKVSLVPGTEAFGFSTLTAGAATVSTTAACAPSATCVYKLTNCGKNSSTVIGVPAVGTVVVGTSFVIDSYTAAAAVAADTSSICWQIN